MSNKIQKTIITITLAHVGQIDMFTHRVCKMGKIVHEMQVMTIPINAMFILYNNAVKLISTADYLYQGRIARVA